MVKSGHEQPWWLRILDKTNRIVTALTAGFLLYTRSVGVAYFTTGALVCSLTVKVIKRCLRQPRPLQVVAGSKAKKSYGMPSTHSATIAFFATYIVLACQQLPTHPSLPSNAFISRVMPQLLCIPLAVVIISSRIWLGHHTLAQVAVGSGYGVVMATVWFSLWIGGWNLHGRDLEEWCRQSF